MKALTPAKVRQLDRSILESQFLRLQIYNAALRTRLNAARQRTVLIERYVKSLKEYLIPETE